MVVPEELSRLTWDEVGCVDLDAATVALGDPRRLGDTRNDAAREDVGVINGAAWLRTHDDLGYPVEVLRGPAGLRAVRVEMVDDLAQLEAAGEGSWAPVGAVTLTGPWLAVMDPYREELLDAVADLPATADELRWFGEPEPVGCALPWSGGVHGVQAFIWGHGEELGIRLTCFDDPSSVRSAGRACGRCHGPMLRYIYGLTVEPPGPGVILGGCAVSDEAPDWTCPWCGVNQTDGVADSTVSGASS